MPAPSPLAPATVVLAGWRVLDPAAGRDMGADGAGFHALFSAFTYALYIRLT